MSIKFKIINKSRVKELLQSSPILNALLNHGHELLVFSFSVLTCLKQAMSFKHLLNLLVCYLLFPLALVLLQSLILDLSSLGRSLPLSQNFSVFFVLKYTQVCIISID